MPASWLGSGAVAMAGFFGRMPMYGDIFFAIPAVFGDDAGREVMSDVARRGSAPPRTLGRTMLSCDDCIVALGCVAQEVNGGLEVVTDHGDAITVTRGLLTRIGSLTESATMTMAEECRCRCWGRDLVRVHLLYCFVP